MTYLFHDLDKLCNALNYSINYAQGAACLSKNFREETENIRKKLKDIYFKPYCLQTFEKFITLHHNALVERLDELTKRLLNIREESDQISSAEIHDRAEAALSAYAQLSDLLEFIHIHFSNFIPKHLPIPKQSLAAPRQEIAEAKACLEQILSSACLEDLKNLILKPFNDFLTGRNKHTWHHLFYCRAIHKELQWQSGNVLPDTENLMWMLYRLNYNHPSYYNLLIQYIQQIDADNYLQTLYHIQRKTRQLLMVPNMVYRHEHPSIDKLLENWLREEIAYIKKTAQLPLSLGAESLKSEKEPAEKLQANISVAELAYLYKVMAEIGMIKITNSKEFFRAIVGMYSTKQSKSISLDSFRVKFYSPEPGIQKAVKQLIILLLNRINLSL